jgi:hypothetical protein
MSNEAYAFAFDNALKEVKNVCPDLATTFIFDENSETVAKDPETSQEVINKVMDEFHSIQEKAETIGGLETVTVQGSEGRLNITRIDNFYLATVVSKEADEKFVGALYRVLIPTVAKLVDQLPTAATNEAPMIAEPEVTQESIEHTYHEGAFEETQPFSPENTEPETVESEYAETEYAASEQSGFEEANDEGTAVEEQVEPIVEEQDGKTEDLEENGPVLPEPPVTQVIVESLSGLLIKSDTVRIDNSVIARWNDLYGDRKIQEVDLEALDGKTTRCKFKPIKDSKYEGKGVIQMPEKIQLALGTSSGELVMVKPAVE